MDVILHIDSLRCGYRNSHQNIYVPKALISSFLQIPLLIALIGKNGTGKSTLLRTLSGLQKPLEGNILLNKKNINKYTINDRSKILSFLPSQNAKIPYIKVKEYVSLGKSNSFFKFHKKQKDVYETLSYLQLEHKAENFLTQLSDGEMQRTAIAKVIFQDSSIMIFDEPLSHLDPKQQLNILSLFFNLVKEQQKTIIFSTHLTDIVLKYAHKIWLITEDSFIEKIPEQIIIDKDLEKNELKIETNEYLPFSRITKCCVRIIGDGVSFKYTKYAFLRYGIKTDCNKNVIFSVIIQQNNNGNYSWLLKKENVIIKEFNKLEDIIVYLMQNL
jgi:iron complex transport system ATP-binding protein